MRFFASCGKGLEYLLVDELIALGCAHATATTAGANVEGTPADAQRAVMWSRLASRILWPITEFDCADEHALSMLPPGRFLMPGDLEGSPALTFAPLDISPDHDAAKGSAGAR